MCSCEGTRKLAEAEQKIKELEGHIGLLIDMGKAHRNFFAEEGYLDEYVQIQELLDEINGVNNEANKKKT